jgi:hypothetical protein
VCSVNRGSVPSKRRGCWPRRDWVREICATPRHHLADLGITMDGELKYRSVRLALPRTPRIWPVASRAIWKPLPLDSAWRVPGQDEASAEAHYQRWLPFVEGAQTTSTFPLSVVHRPGSNFGGEPASVTAWFVGVASFVKFI